MIYAYVNMICVYVYNKNDKNSVIQNAANQKSVIDHTLGNLLDNALKDLMLKFHQDEF